MKKTMGTAHCLREMLVIMGMSLACLIALTSFYSPCVVRILDCLPMDIRNEFREYGTHHRVVVGRARLYNLRIAKQACRAVLGGAHPEPRPLLSRALPLDERPHTAFTYNRYDISPRGESMRLFAVKDRRSRLEVVEGTITLDSNWRCGRALVRDC
jgi:hypothetical protein